MKKIMVPMLALLLLIGGGVGAYFYMGKSEAVASGGEDPAKAAKAAENTIPDSAAYVKMPPIMLPIIGRDGISQTISMVVSLQVVDDIKASEIQKHLPKLADAYLSDMYGTLSQQASMEGGVIKVSTLKSRLMSITQKVMGEDAVQDVLLQVLQQHHSG